MDINDIQIDRSGASSDVYAICTEGDELIPDHRTEVVSNHAPIMIPGGAHRMTNEQRDCCLSTPPKSPPK